ncbi:hypothetical protein, partial [Ellagibacter isourolithinifaciens]|uniref:hypothetical protein n=1 Tax=Ellagibacter isourolithinifaciens TaxID=2137581 RepID=UPI003AEF3DB6
VDENHPISGRTPQYLCTSGNWVRVRRITRPLSRSSGASAAAIGDESPSRLSLRVRHFKANIPRDVNAIHDAAFNEVESVIERTTLLRSQKDALI